MADYLCWPVRDADRRAFPWTGAARGERRRCRANPQRCDQPDSGIGDADRRASGVAGRYYINIHTAANPPGEIRGQVTK